jgi:nitronate monooxygenase
MTLQELLGIDLPIIQAPMAGVQGSALAIAVSNAGGLGSLPCALLDPGTLQSELETIKAQTTKPFNVNFFCHTPPQPNAERENAWRTSLASYYQELGVAPPPSTAGPGRIPFSADIADIIEPFQPPVVSFHFGLPSDELLRRVKGWGAKVFSSATTVAEALWLEARGVDAIIAQGWEAGGHRGSFLSDDLTEQLGTFALLPQIVQAVQVPVVAAGGIANAKGVAAALTLGAVGVQVGTAYLLCPEVNTNAIHRAALKSSAVRHTAVTNVFTGRPAPSNVNRIIKELGPISMAPPAFPLATEALAPIGAKSASQGSGDFIPLWCGQNASGCQEIPAAELTRLLAAF